MQNPYCDTSPGNSHESDYRVELHKDDDAEIFDLCRDHTVDAIEDWLDNKSEQWDELRVVKYPHDMTVT